MQSGHLYFKPLNFSWIFIRSFRFVFIFLLNNCSILKSSRTHPFLLFIGYPGKNAVKFKDTSERVRDVTWNLDTWRIRVELLKLACSQVKQNSSFTEEENSFSFFSPNDFFSTLRFVCFSYKWSLWRVLRVFAFIS